MRALLLSAPGTFEYREVEPPVAPEGWVRIRMRYVGICGSDVHYYSTGRIGDQVVTYPHTLGHECSGEILEGAGQLEPGTRVYVEPAIFCGSCDQCRACRENTCRNLKFLGNPGEIGGGMCQEMAMPMRCVAPLPEEIGLEEAVLLEPLCIGVYAVARSQLCKGGTAAIVGAGPIGLTALLALSELQPREVLVSEPIEARRKAAELLGADSTFDPAEAGAGDAVFDASQGGVDAAFDCAGTQESIDDAARMLKPGGTLVLIGIPPELDRVTYDPNLMRRREITIVNIRRQNRMIHRAVSLLARRRDASRALITHKFPPTRAKEAFELVRQRADGVIKAVIEF